MQHNDILLKAIMDGGKHSIIVTRRDGTVTFINQAAERLYGYEASHFVGKPIDFLRQKIYDHGQLEKEAEDMSREVGQPVALDEVFRVALDRHDLYERERTAVHRDGTILHVLVTVTAMRDENGEIVGYLSVSQDISERKKLERMKSEFISTVSHELRTPLTSIRGALGLMVGGAAGPLPQAAADLAAIAYRNSERLVRIINDILDMEKVESGKLDFDIKDFDAVALVAQSLEENRSYGDKYGVIFRMVDTPESLNVTADPDRVLQILANLLSNAAKFSRHGGEVHIRIAREERFAVISVRDFGAGIPEEFRPRIFEKFAQSEAGNAGRREGTGLGLSITQRLVEAMGGAIDFVTETGKGTTFSFRLPLALRAATTAAAERGAPTPASPGPVVPVTPAASANPPIPRDASRILVCEDDRDVARLLALLLERVGFRVDLAHDIAGAREKLRDHDYAAMTLDVVLPDGDGLAFLSELRAGAATADLPVVVVSGVERSGRVQDSHAVELVDWISKPIDEGALVRSLRRATRKIQSAFPRILHVEDNDDMRRILEELFQGQAEWIGAATLQQAKALLRSEPFDLIVLDIGMPDGSGLELMEKFDTPSGRPVPVLILSATEPRDARLRQRVAAVLLKSRVSEEQVVRTVLNLVRGPAAQAPPQGQQ